MNRVELVAKLASRTHLTKTEARLVIDAVFNPKDGLVARELARGGKVVLPGFGGFSVRKRAARSGRNPATGKAITISSRRFASFTATAGLKMAVANARFSPILGKAGAVLRGRRMLCPIDPDVCPAKYRRVAGETLWCDNHPEVEMVPARQLGR